MHANTKGTRSHKGSHRCVDREPPGTRELLEAEHCQADIIQKVQKTPVALVSPEHMELPTIPHDTAICQHMAKFLRHVQRIPKGPQILTIICMIVICEHRGEESQQVTLQQFVTVAQ